MMDAALLLCLLIVWLTGGVKSAGVVGDSSWVDDDDWDWYASSYSSSVYESDGAGDGTHGIRCTCKPVNVCSHLLNRFSGYKLLDSIFSSNLAMTSLTCIDESNLGGQDTNFTKVGYKLPPSIGRLTKLSKLRLDLQLIGTIPEELYNLTKLERLEIVGDSSRSRLSGRVSPRVGKLTMLRSLTLGPVLLGSIPRELALLKSLENLELTGMLSGSIPLDLLEQMPELRSLVLGGSFSNVQQVLESVSLGRLPLARLEIVQSGPVHSEGLPEPIGPIRALRREPQPVEPTPSPTSPVEIVSAPVRLPEGLLSASKLTRLVLRQQSVEGRIPSMIRDDLEELDLSENALEGEIPGRLGELEKLTSLSLAGNPSLVGKVPNGIWGMYKLTRLALGRTGLQLGSLRDGLLQRLARLEVLDLSGLGIRGQLPRDLEKLTRLRELDLSSNQLEGAVPRISSGELARLNLRNNSLTSFPFPLPGYDYPRGARFAALDDNRFLCDCTLTHWFGNLFGDGLQGGQTHPLRSQAWVLGDADNVRCSDGNSLSGTPVALTRYAYSAPCSQPLDLTVRDAHSRGALLSWRLSPFEQATWSGAILKRPAGFYAEALAARNKTALPDGQRFLDRAASISRSVLPGVIDPESTRKCWECQAVDLPISQEDALRNPLQFQAPALAFELAVRGGHLDREISVCCSASDFYADNATRELRVELSSLEPAEKYTVLTRLINVRFDVEPQASQPRMARLSTSPWTAPITFTTPDAEPRSPPLSFRQTAAQDGSISLAWKAPQIPGGEVVLYEVACETRPKVLPGGVLDEIPVFSPVLTTKGEALRINGLVPETSYAVKVRAFTRHGPGPWSAPILANTLAKCPAGTEKREAVFPSPSGSMECALCEPGFFSPDGQRCISCPDMFPVTKRNGSASIEDCLTGWGYFKQEGEAKRCKLGMECNGDGITLETLALTPGFWRESLLCAEVVKCREAGFCNPLSSDPHRLLEEKGASDLNNNVSQYCSPHHTGVECLACEPGYAVRSSGGLCELCTDEDQDHDTRAIAGWCIILVLCVVYNAIRVLQAARVVYHKTLVRSTFFSTPVRAKQEETSQAQELEQEPPHEASNHDRNVCYCVACEQALTTDGLRVEDSARQAHFYHNSCFIESLSRAALQNTTVQRVVVEGHEMSRLVSFADLNVTPPMTPPSSAPKPALRIRMRRVFDSIKEVLESCVSVKVRILIGFLQVYFAYYSTFRAPAMDLNGSFVSVLSLVNFDISSLLDIFGVRCTWDHDHYDSLALYTLSPLIYASTVFIAYRFVSSCVYACCPDARTAAKTDAYTRILFAIFVVLPGASRKVFQTFICEDHLLADGVIITTSALHADPRISCNGPDRSQWIAYAAVMVAIFPVGIIATIAFLLWTVRAIRRKPEFERSPSQQHKIDRVAFLLRPYTVDAYWFEAYEMLRKVLQTTLVLFVVQLSGSRQVGIFLCLTLSGISVFILVLYNPYLRKNDLYLAIISQLVLFNACVCSLLESFTLMDSLMMWDDAMVQHTSSYTNAVAAAFLFEFLAFLALSIFDVYQAIASKDAATALAKSTSSDETADEFPDPEISHQTAPRSFYVVRKPTTQDLTLV